MPSCTFGPSVPERGERAGAAAQHRDKEARCRLAKPLDMAQHLVDPHRRLVAEGRRHRVLTVGAARRSASPRRARRDRPSPRAPRRSGEKKAVRRRKHQKVAGLRDVLRRRPPMHPAAMGSPTTRRVPRQAARWCGRCAQSLRRCGRGRGVRAARFARSRSAASMGMMPSSACAGPAPPRHRARPASGSPARKARGFPGSDTRVPRSAIRRSCFPAVWQKPRPSG